MEVPTGFALPAARHALHGDKMFAQTNVTLTLRAVHLLSDAGTDADADTEKYGHDPIAEK